MMMRGEKEELIRKTCRNLAPTAPMTLDKVEGTVRPFVAADILEPEKLEHLFIQCVRMSHLTGITPAGCARQIVGVMRRE